jgi:hypothetical protein
MTRQESLRRWADLDLGEYPEPDRRALSRRKRSAQKMLAALARRAWKRDAALQCAVAEVLAEGGAEVSVRWIGTRNNAHRSVQRRRSSEPTRPPKEFGRPRLWVFLPPRGGFLPHEIQRVRPLLPARRLWVDTPAGAMLPVKALALVRYLRARAALARKIRAVMPHLQRRL